MTDQPTRAEGAADPGVEGLRKLVAHIRSEAEHFRSERARKSLTSYGDGAADAIFNLEKMLEEPQP